MTYIRAYKITIGQVGYDVDTVYITLQKNIKEALENALNFKEKLLADNQGYCEFNTVIKCIEDIGNGDDED